MSVDVSRFSQSDESVQDDAQLMVRATSDFQHFPYCLSSNEGPSHSGERPDTASCRGTWARNCALVFGRYKCRKSDTQLEASLCWRDSVAQPRGLVEGPSRYLPGYYRCYCYGNGVIVVLTLGQVDEEEASSR